MSVRSERISEQIRGEIGDVLRDEITDPRIGLLSVTRVKVSKDLSHALVMWSPLASDEVEIDDMEEGLASASGYVRKQLARRLNLRRTPALEFRFDPSIAEGSRTLSLIRDVIEEDESKGSEAEDGQTS